MFPFATPVLQVIIWPAPSVPGTTESGCHPLSLAPFGPEQICCTYPHPPAPQIPALPRLQLPLSQDSRLRKEICLPNHLCCHCGHTLGWTGSRLVGDSSRRQQPNPAELNGKHAQSGPVRDGGLIQGSGEGWNRLGSTLLYNLEWPHVNVIQAG